MRHWTADEWDELRRERAAIMEVDGGLSRAEAERAAGIWVALVRLSVSSTRVQSRAAAQARSLGVSAAAVTPPSQTEMVW